MKRKGLLAVFICMVILGGCGGPKDTNESTGASSDTPSVAETTNNLQAISVPDLGTEQGIREYLSGEWVFNQGYVSDITCKMLIGEDLKIDLSFQDIDGKSKGDYTGQITLDRAYATAKEVPDLISIELTGTEDIGGNFLFRHRTVYDGKRVMSWFFAGMDSCIFDILGPENSESVPDEIIFEKATGEASKLSPRKNAEFYAVFWAKGVKGKKLWLDDVRWTPPAEDDFATLYPRQMTLYENDSPESVLYDIVADEVSEILGDDLFPGTVYFVKTDQLGKVTQFIDAEYKEYMTKSSDGSLDPQTQALIFDIVKNEIKEYLDMGMAVLLTGETTELDGEDCYDVAVGTNHDEHFVREMHYAVNISTRQVYRYDVIMDKWE